jgi:isopenicillin N synthase-like dioxygenase
MAFADLPVVDFEALCDPTRTTATRTLGASLERFGFVAITNHRITQDQLAAAYVASRDVFALPTTTKRSYEDIEGSRQRGYTSYGVERAADSDVADLKEFWHVGRSSPLQPKPLNNRFPIEVPAFEQELTQLFGQFEAHAMVVLTALERHLGCPTGALTEMAWGGNSVVRLIHYPPLPEHMPEGALRASEHEDINLITLLPVATEPGLEIQTRDGQWLAVRTPPDVLVCDTGDMMAYFTGGRLPATTHRVVNPSGAAGREPRYSMPFFCHPRPETVLAPMRGDAPPITAGALLQRRLEEIGVARPSR